jgi:hypothetical protein
MRRPRDTLARESPREGPVCERLQFLSLLQVRSDSLSPYPVTVRFLRRHEHGRGQARSFGGVAETFDARNRGARVQAMDI